ncbi:MAG TPA: hypothetical protein VJ552_05260 [Sediminibacterium sp.]|nr:hypothetical protein [Sediminibacterium sp.]
MASPKNQRTYRLLGLKFNPLTQLYEITENGVTYEIPFALTYELKTYFQRGVEVISVEDWYKELLREDKARVKRSGHNNDADDTFYPDRDFTE